MTFLYSNTVRFPFAGQAMCLRMVVVISQHETVRWPVRAAARKRFRGVFRKAVVCVPEFFGQICQEGSCAYAYLWELVYIELGFLSDNGTFPSV